MEKEMKKIRFMEPMIHIMVWVIIFGFPFLLMTNTGSLDWGRLFHHSIVPLSFFIVFYLNFFILIPRFLSPGRYRTWITANILVVIVLGVLMQYCQMYLLPGPGGRHPDFKLNPGILFFLRDSFTLLIVIGIAVSIQFSRRALKAEDARKEEERMRIEAERGRTEAELRNLRNQLNPHFLLNTLNNIYALIAFDTDRAQSAVAELSKLLRYVLYDNQQNTVSLGKEIDFILNYISLMRIRLSPDVDVRTHIEVSEDSRTEIAPLLFISLIENAFKHGVSPVGKSFIDISIREDASVIVCGISNSYHPKTCTDKSGSGIGLEHLRKRLDLIYPGRYTWEYGPDSGRTVYRSVLTISKSQTPGLS